MTTDGAEFLEERRVENTSASKLCNLAGKCTTEQ